AALVQLSQDDRLPRGRHPVQVELRAQGVGDGPRHLDLEPRLTLALRGEREVRRVGAEPDPSSLPLATRGRRQQHGDREGADSHSLSPNTTTMSLQFTLVACAHFGSLPNQTCERRVPPAATATYCLPSTAKLMIPPDCGVPRLNDHS